MTLRIKRPDKKNAESLLQSAKEEMLFTLTIPITDASGSTIVRNIYECFRKLGDAILIAKGIESHDHKEPMQALMTLSVSTHRPLGAIDNLRRLRHNINYYGYKPTLPEVNDILSLAKELFKPVASAVEKEIKQ